MTDDAFRTDTLDFEAAASLVDAFAARSGYTSVEIRSVTWLSKGEWRNGLCVARALLDSPAEQASLDYPEVRLASAAMKPADLGAWLLAAKDGQVGIGDRHVGRNPATYVSRSRLAGFNRLAAEPGDLLELGTTQHEHPPQSWRPLLGPGLPYHADLTAAVREWLRQDDFGRSGSEQYGRVLLFLPDTRARFSSMRYAHGQLSVTTAGQLARKPLEVKGEYRHDQKATRLDASVKRGAATLPVPDTIDRLDLYLLGKDGTVFDYHQETRWSNVGHPPAVLVPPPADPGRTAIEEALRRGECETVEFKPFVRPKDPKFDQVIETVIAFANTRGGVLLIGVDDDGEVVGVDRELPRHARTEGGEAADLARARDAYVVQVRKGISAVVTPSVDFNVHAVTFGDRTLILVDVPRGAGGHYNLWTRDRRVRRGSTNFRPPPEPGHDSTFPIQPFGAR